MSDPGSLQNLNEIVQAGPVAWWPPAPGWYVLAGVLALAAAWATFRGLVRWQRSRYRREARRELDAIRRDGPAAAPRVPVLLKRVALSAWPRERVAGLTGEDWLTFLDRAAQGGGFSGRGGALLERAAYGAGAALSAEEFEALCAEARRWIREHRPPQE